jgi:hypothetical protein
MININGSSEVAVALLTFAAVVLRAELAVYLAVYGFFVLLKSRIKFKRLFFIGICSAAFSIGKFSSLKWLYQY